MVDRGDADPGESSHAAGPDGHRVARLADMREAGPSAPVLSLHGIDAEPEQASVVDLRPRPDEIWAAPAGPGDHLESSRPTARVIQIPSGGKGSRGRTKAPLPRSASVVDPDDEPDAPDVEAKGAEPAARRRGTGRGRRSEGRQETRRSSERRSAATEPDADPVAVAREICLRLLTERARTRQELAQALRKRDVPDDAAAVVLERFDEVGLIDDAAFAGQWVRSRHNRRGLARRAIAFELRRKGVDEEVAREALVEVDATSEEQRARELVEHKLRTVPADTPEQRVAAARRLVGMLARKGYSGGIAYRVVREALAAHGADIDELAGPDD
ncbi:MAG TPA: regulatory protein RecX [Pseudonocardia sp.]